MRLSVFGWDQITNVKDELEFFVDKTVNLTVKKYRKKSLQGRTAANLLVVYRLFPNNKPIFQHAIHQII